MSYDNLSQPAPSPESPAPQRSPRILVNVILFILTFFTATIAGIQWSSISPFELMNFAEGLPYALSILFILASHEFGHYFAARYHNVRTTLPYFIPFPPVPFFINFGTLGAVIRTRSVVPSKKAMFDIGVAGPIAGFIASLLVLIYGFLTLPGKEYILGIHPHYDFRMQLDPTSTGLPLEFGATILYKLFETLLTDPHTQFVPPMTEMYHYPYLCVGWFGLFVTAMNMIPVGQFDGGHIIYSMFGDAHRRIARWAFAALLVLGLPSILDSVIRSLLSLITDSPPLQVIPFAEYSWGGWFLWAIVSYYLVKLYHPPVPDETPLDESRMMIGWISLVIFALSFSFIPFTIPI